LVGEQAGINHHVNENDNKNRFRVHPSGTDDMAPEDRAGPKPTGNPDPSATATKGETSPTVADLRPTDQPMEVLIAGILLLGSISLFIAWGLSNAYQ
jgi:hypothetical protein